MILRGPIYIAEAFAEDHMVVLAVGDDLAEMVEFVKTYVDTHNHDFYAFRISHHGASSASTEPTHLGSATKN